MSQYKEDQREICREKARYICEVCVKIGDYKRGTQCAHMIPQKGYLIKKYGYKVIHHHSNLRLVCDLKCNSKAMIPVSDHEEKVRQIKKIIAEES